MDPRPKQPVLLGVDVGGTFTDAVLVAGGRLFRAKVPTTSEQSLGVLESAARVLAKAGFDPRQVSYFAHGMTTATNALLERKGARTASVTTEGFRDILEIGRQNRPRLYDLCPHRPEPLIEPAFRFTAPERVSPRGVSRSLDADEARQVAEQLARLKPEAVAVCLLFSFIDSSHEKELGEAIAGALPGAHVSLSSSVLPQFREYERFSTTAVDAYLTPVVKRYLTRLGEGAREAGLPDPAIMQSSGGVLPVGTAALSAAPLLLSGPAAGVVGAIHAGERSGVDDLMAFDMGGTSTDVTLVRGGRAAASAGREIGGQPVALPMIDIHTIGAGGGSIAWIDTGGALRVGPKSAGAEPGPACYGHGGVLPTVTDANLFLGYLGERLGGPDGLRLDAGAARKALESLASELAVSLEETAMGIRQVADAEMVRALRVISVERGHDPRNFALAAFGGAGPMHAADLARELGMTRVMLPDSCGVLSALGMVVGDERRDWVRTVYTGGSWDESSLESAFEVLEEAKAQESAGAILERSADMRYRGQSHELTVPAQKGISAAALSSAFEEAHEAAFGYRAEDEPVELVNIRLTAIRRHESPKIGRPPAAPGEPAVRQAYFDGAWTAAGVYRRESLGTAKVSGPAVIEEDEATTVVPPGWIASIDERGNLWLTG